MRPKQAAESAWFARVVTAYKALKEADRTLSDRLLRANPYAVAWVVPNVRDVTRSDARRPDDRPEDYFSGDHDRVRQEAAAAHLTRDLFGDEGLPPALYEDPSEYRQSDVDVIPATKIVDLKALIACVAILRKVDRAPSQPPTYTDRLPGLLWTRDREVAVLARALNAAKDHFANMVAGITPSPAHAEPDAGTSVPHSKIEAARARRAKFDGTEMRHVMLLEAYRNVVVIEAPVDQISFGWACNSQIVERINVEDAIDYCEKRAPIEASGYAATLRALDCQYVARVRPQAPYVFANARIAGSWSGGKRRQNTATRLHAALPIIIVSNEKPEIKDLVTYVRNEGRGKKPARALEAEPVIEGLRLYAYLPAHHERILAEERRRRRAPALSEVQGQISF